MRILLMHFLLSRPVDYSQRNGQAATVDFWMYRYFYGYPATADAVEVYINTTNSLNGAILLGKVNRDYRLDPIESGPNSWRHYTMNIPDNMNGSTNYIIFKGLYINGGQPVFLDDITITEFNQGAVPPVPLLVSPANSQISVPVFAKFNWSLLPYDGNPLDYVYQVEITNENTYSVILDSLVEFNNSLNIKLDDVNTYSWRVRTVQNGIYGAWSSTFIFTTMNYCTPISLLCSEYTQHITSVQFSNIINGNTLCGTTTESYSNYSDMIAFDTLGVSKEITVTVANGLAGDRVAAWFDWDQNGQFNNGTELVELSSSDGISYTGNVTVPLNAPYGYCRMRVRIFSEIDNISACNLTSVGNAQDYTVLVVPCHAGYYG